MVGGVCGDRICQFCPRFPSAPGHVGQRNLGSGPVCSSKLHPSATALCAPLQAALTTAPHADVHDTPQANILPPIFAVRSSMKKAAIDPQAVPDPEKKTKSSLRWFRRETSDSPAPPQVRGLTPST